MPKFSIPSKASVILVDAQLTGPKGSHTLRLILDTGASYTLINPEPLEFIGYDLAAQIERKRITTASGIEYVPFINLKEIKTLGCHLANLPICVHTLPEGLPAEGLLGLNFLRHFNVHLKFLEGTLEISA